MAQLRKSYLESDATHADVAAEGPEPFLVSITVGELREVALGIARDPSSGGQGDNGITGR